MKKQYRGTIVACYLSSIAMSLCVSLAPMLFVIFSDSFSLSMEMLGRLVLVNFVTQLCADILSIKFVPKVGYRAALVFAHVMITLGLILFGILPMIMQDPYLGLVLSTITYSFGLGVVEANTSSVIDSIPSEAKASDMSLMHSIFCWGQVASIILFTIALKLLGDSRWYLLVFASAVIAAINIVLYL
ncbi:MAG: MFS transporter, partial [Oscillospiraceae bacterium]|nr:MFS transporter [Oscillospiraceae bacterium]